MRRPSFAKSKRGRPNLRKSDRNNRRDSPREKNRRRRPERPELPGRAETMEGLVPIGGGFYASAWEEPVSPTDCERWPNSIFCSGLFSSDIRDLPGVRDSFGAPGLGFNYIFDECNVGIQIDPYLFVALPSTQIVWRRPGVCRFAGPAEPVLGGKFDNLPRPIPKIPWRPATQPMRLLIHIPEGFKFGGMVEIEIEGKWRRYWTVVSRFINSSGDEIFRSQSRVRNQLGFPVPQEECYVGNPFGNVAYELLNISKVYFWRDLRGPEERRFSSSIAPSSNHRNSPDLYYFVGWNYGSKFSNGRAQIGGAAAYWIFTSPEEARRWEYEREDFSMYYMEWPPTPPPTPTPPPPIPSNLLPTPPMKCCKNPNEDATRAVLKELRKLNEKLGDFPVKVENYEKRDPKKTGYRKNTRTIKSIADGIKLTYESADKVNAVTDADRMIKEGYKLPKRLIYPLKNGDKSIVRYDSIPRLFEYIIKQMDRSVGALPQRIKIADGDPNQEGAQKVEIESHSLADLMRRNLEISIDSEADIDTTNLMLFRAMLSIATIQQLSVKNYSMLDSLVEWADFKVKETVKKIRLAFNPFAGEKRKKKKAKGFGETKQPAKAPTDEESLEAKLVEFLKEAEIKVPVIENDETGHTQSGYYREILKYAQLAGEASTEVATPERLEQLVNASYEALRMQGFVDRSNVIRALTGGHFSKGNPSSGKRR